MGRFTPFLIVCAGVIGLQDQPARFRSSVRTIEIYTTVQAEDGRFVPGLTRDDFELFDNGKPQPITTFDNSPQKITVAAMFDMSNSMAREYWNVRAAGSAFVRALWPEDRARIGSFGAEGALSPLLTGDKVVLQRILDEELWPGGATPLWYATDMAMTALDREQGRRVILLVTDGDDESPFLRPSADDVRVHAERGGFIIYAIGLPGTDLSVELSLLIDQTGGGRFLVGAHDDLGAAFVRAVEELHSQYLLGFSMPVADGKRHAVSVKVKRDGAKARGRKTYVASTEGAL